MNHDTTPISDLSGSPDQIPCFRGYRDVQYRRESDQLFRDKLAEMLQSSMERLDRHLARQVDRGILSSLAAGERLKSRTDQTLRTIRATPDNSSPFFDACPCDDVQLSRLAELENKLLQNGNAIEQISTALANNDSPSLDAIGAFARSLDELGQTFALRSQRIESLPV
ncbi:hypothetical protein EC9_18530 [Rosistilla ulvae]|uniref:Uncharacterized protein n=1 Tax=Rosistilla ulvae TaxID=1930277 RepID=A0A517LYH8_9BACT|nr:hypothetical protein [Rosistilla ulvae]QDS87674.1 hypothetical protein EC9_18530 [Rosistilla ulvae]